MCGIVLHLVGDIGRDCGYAVDLGGGFLGGGLLQRFKLLELSVGASLHLP